MNINDIEIKIYPSTKSSQNIIAYVSLVFSIEIDNEIVPITVSNCRIMVDSFNKQSNGLKFDLPQMKKTNGGYKYTVFINNPNIWSKIQSLVLDKYEKTLLKKEME